MIYQTQEPPPRRHPRFAALFREFAEPWTASVRFAFALSACALLASVIAETWRWGAITFTAVDWLQLAAPLPPLVTAAAFLQFVFMKLVAARAYRIAAVPLVAAISVLGFSGYEEFSGLGARLSHDAVAYHCLEHPGAACRSVADSRVLPGFNDEERTRIQERSDARRRYAMDLSASAQLFLDARYMALLEGFQRRDYASMDTTAREILNVVADYKDARTFLAIAMRGLQAQRERRHAEARQELVEFHHRQIETLVETAGELRARATRDPLAAAELRRLATDVLQREPWNRDANEWVNDMGRGPASRRR